MLPPEVKGPMREDLVGNSIRSFLVASYVAMTGLFGLDLYAVDLFERRCV